MKIDRAFGKLDEIKPHITKWWTAGGEAPQLLINREYAVAEAFDGRCLSAIKHGAPIKMSFDGAVTANNMAHILKGGPNTVNAQRLAAFQNRAEIAAAFTQATGYPTLNANQLKYLPAELKPFLSISPENVSGLVLEDTVWLATKLADGKTNADRLQELFTAWRIRA